MTNLSRRLLITGATGGLASLVFGAPALAWSDRSYGSPLGRGRVRQPEPEPDPLYEGSQGAPPEDSFWGNPSPQRPVDPRGSGQVVATEIDDGPIDYARAYEPVPGEPFPIPPFRWRRANPAFLRQQVAYGGRFEPGTIVIDPRAHHLYLVQGGGLARRYGVGVGRQGFAWSGIATVNSKQAWPDWYPPKEMIARQPALARQVSQLQSGLGVPGGPRNPLGARAMYLWQNNKDTLYRIHGTTEPESIGRSVSSGCIRMINQDVIDLYARVAVGAQVHVIG
ncbi:L,D-transpeptidase [uncultured Methylobacterium sp.]|jgi:lipoprotein-anchoring transpeptidase ErfK/SrfK|uniref:L,D-transpeptidase n=1 Tax=uncultured Methylobacterium sp. TaxID=157278 RepID=UPI00263922D5|nr:L,D-transpeptidase [uncultured Methylobacterium sp.]